MASPQRLPLEEGWWRGVVKFTGGPAEFLLEVRRVDTGEPHLVVYSEGSSVVLADIAQDEDRLVLAGPSSGERFDGRLRDGVYFGRYHAGGGEAGGAYAFWMEPAAPWEPVPPLRVWNLTGNWVMSTGPGRDVEVAIAHFGERLRGCWRDGGGRMHYLVGRLDGPQFVLSGARTTATLTGRYDSGGLLSGDYLGDDGETRSFVMRRKASHAPRSGL